MTCSRTECGGTARWHPVLQFHPPKTYRNRNVLPAILGLALCDACRGNAKLDDFLSKDVEEVVRNLAKGLDLAMPDFTATTLGWEPLGSEKSNMLTKTKEQKNGG